MVCTAEKYTPISQVAKLVIEEINEKTEIGAAQRFLAVQRRGFGGKETAAVTENEAKRFLRMLGSGKE